MRLNISKLIASIFLGVPGAFFIGIAISEVTDFAPDFLLCWITAAALTYYLLMNIKLRPQTGTDVDADTKK